LSAGLCPPAPRIFENEIEQSVQAELRLSGEIQMF
jgi:hypothetical protein